MTLKLLSLLLATVLLIQDDDLEEIRAELVPPLSLAPPTAAAPPVAEQIKLELTRPNDDPIGRPLPIAAHWNTGSPSSPRTGWDPNFVLDYLDAGEYVIPTFNLQRPTVPAEPWDYYESGLQRARAAGLPIAIRFTQWDRLFTDDPAYFNLPPDENPNVIDASDGKTIIPMSDPGGPVERWREAGADWGSLPILAQMQAAYPDPPLVIWLNNFEQPRLWGSDAETSWRFVQEHGLETTADEKRAIVGNGWIERDGALWFALQDELTEAWQSASIPVCYNAYGRRGYGSWSGWDRASLHVPDRFAPWPLVVNGSASYYVFGDPKVHPETDYEANGPQMSGMNWLFMLDEARRDTPDYFWEVSIYDGGLERQTWYREEMGQVYDAARYRGYVRFALWLARPRILREFRLSAHDREPYLEYWKVVLDAVREIHRNGVLRRFWRKGEPVVNRADPHHFQFNLYPGYTDDDVDRNFLLEASVNPPRPWNNDTVIEVWSLALRLGEAPNREWLLFAYAPLRDQADVKITVPGFGELTIDVPRGDGVFRVLRE